jgi:hypothetical protein
MSKIGLSIDNICLLSEQLLTLQESQHFAD